MFRAKVETPQLALLVALVDLGVEMQEHPAALVKVRAVAFQILTLDLVTRHSAHSEQGQQAKFMATNTFCPLSEVQGEGDGHPIQREAVVVAEQS